MTWMAKARAAPDTRRETVRPAPRHAAGARNRAADRMADRLDATQPRDRPTKPAALAAEPTQTEMAARHRGTTGFASVPLRPPVETPGPANPFGPASTEVRNSSGDDAPKIAGGIVGGLLGGAAGAGIGFALGGPVGAVIGGILGAAGGAAAGVAIGSAASKGGGQQGNARSVDLQPVFFRDSANDASPTGGSWSRRFGPSNTIWGKLGVTYSESSPVFINDATLKAAGTDRAERDAVRDAHSDAGKVCVFLTDNELAEAGGGATVGGGAAGAKIAMSDRGTSTTLLAHELGHALGLGHPPDGADADTIMQPSGSIDAENPTRNTLGNYNLITWPAAGAPVTINPDP